MSDCGKREIQQGGLPDRNQHSQNSHIWHLAATFIKLGRTAKSEGGRERERERARERAPRGRSHGGCREAARIVDGWNCFVFPGPSWHLSLGGRGDCDRTVAPSTNKRAPTNTTVDRRCLGPRRRWADDSVRSRRSIRCGADEKQRVTVTHALRCGTVGWPSAAGCAPAEAPEQRRIWVWKQVRRDADQQAG